MSLEPDILTRLVFNDIVVVQISSDYVEDDLWLEIFNKNDQERERRSVHLEPDEVDLLISALNLYKNRILKGRGKDAKRD